MDFRSNSRLPYWTVTEHDQQELGRLDPKNMRVANSREILRLLRKHSPCSRADLVRFSGLTAPTVSAAVDTLQRRGLISFLGAGTSSGGRPPRLLEFNARHGFVFGADIGGSTVRLALADLNGATLGRWSTPLKADRSPEAVTDVIAAGIQHLREQQGIPAKKVLELAAGAPGITDVHAGRVVSAPNLTGWDDVPLRDLLEEKTGISTTVDNDVNLGAMGESWCGVARNVPNFVFLAIGTGIGAGIVMNGLVHHGSKWSAGEVGYLMVPGLPTGPLKVDRLGALESAIGGKAVEKCWLEMEGANSRKRLSATEIFDLAVHGDSQARELLRAMAERLALAITNIALVLDISLVILGGGVGAHEALAEATRRALAKNEFARPEIVVSHLGPDAQVQGAIWLALRAAEVHGFRRTTKTRGSVPAETAEVG